MSVNKVILIGRLGQNPEFKYSGAGLAICNISIATSEAWKDKSGAKQEKTCWHRIVTFGKFAEIANENLSKGSQIYLEGKLETRSYEKDGAKRFITEVKADVIKFLDLKKGANSSNAKSDEDENSFVPENNENDEIDF